MGAALLTARAWRRRLRAPACRAQTRADRTCAWRCGPHGVLVCHDARARGRQEELDFNLVVFSPYRDLMVFLKDAGMLDAAECAWCAGRPCRSCSRRACAAGCEVLRRCQWPAAWHVHCGMDSSAAPSSAGLRSHTHTARRGCWCGERVLLL